MDKGKLTEKITSLKQKFNSDFDAYDISDVQIKLSSLILLQDEISDAQTCAYRLLHEKSSEFYDSLTTQQVNQKAEHLKAQKNKYCLTEQLMVMKIDNMQKDNHYAIEGLRSILSNLKNERQNTLTNQ